MQNAHCHRLENKANRQSKMFKAARLGITIGMEITNLGKMKQEDRSSVISKLGILNYIKKAICLEELEHHLR